MGEIEFSQWRPEVELLLCCALPEIEAQRRARLAQLLEGPIEWEQMLQLGKAHGMTPLLDRHLSTETAAPVWFRTQLAAIAGATAGHSGFLAGELAALLGQFAERGIEAAPYKGVMLGYQLYGDVALRPVEDLDLFVRRADLERAQQVLIENGYRLLNQSSPAGNRLYLHNFCEHHFVHRRHRTLVELHWGVTPVYFSFELDLDGMWRRRQETSLQGTPAFTFAPQDLLLMLCIHGSKHRWSQLKWVSDVAQLARCYPNLEWESVLAQATAMGARRVLLLGLLLAKRLLDAPLSSSLVAAIAAERRIGKLAQAVETTLFDWPPVERSAAMDMYLQMAMRERLRDRARYAAMVLTGFTETTPVADLPPSFFGLHYALYPLWRLGGFVSRVWAAIREHASRATARLSGVRRTSKDTVVS
jgi:hypothetical protein